MPELPAPRYRVTRIAGDNVLPPIVPGAVLMQAEATTAMLANEEVELAVADRYAGRILLEEERPTDITTEASTWVVTHSWIRGRDGWRHEHGQPTAGAESR